MKPCIYNAHLFFDSPKWGGLPSDAMAYILANAVREKTLTESLWIVLPDELLSVQFVDQLQFWEHKNSNTASDIARAVKTYRKPASLLCRRQRKRADTQI